MIYIKLILKQSQLEGDCTMADMKPRSKCYAIGVINELRQLGYSEMNAKKVLLRHYRDLKRSYGFNLNVYNFAKVIDEIERSINRNLKPDDPNQIYIGHLREQLKMAKKKTDITGKFTFQITKDMEQKISDWDSCTAESVTGTKFAYIFIPSELGLIIKVQCNVCKRELDLSK